MRKNVVTSMVLGALLLAGRPALAADTVSDKIKKSCNKELTTFCKGVVPGEGRVLACLYAFENKVSDQCVQAVYDAAVQLEAGRRRPEVCSERVQGRPPEVLRRREARRGTGAGLPQQARQGREPELQGRAEADRPQEVSRRHTAVPR